MVAKKKKKVERARDIVCTHIVQTNHISNSGLALCRCSKRDFSMTRYNLVCDVCTLYKKSKNQLSVDEVFTSDEELDDFEYDLDDEEQIILLDEEDDDDDDEEDEEEFEESEIEGPMIGRKEEGAAADGEETAADGETEIEESSEEFDEYDEFEEDEDPFGEKESTAVAGNDNVDSGYNFEEEVISKIKKFGPKEMCPFCKKTKPSVIRHLARCDKAPPEAKSGLKAYLAKQKKE